jgi:transposase
MRKGYDSLSGLVNSEMQCNVLGGDFFIFISKRRNQAKLLHWDGDGFSLYCKRLEKGTFEMPVATTDHATITVSWSQLMLILQGISLKSVRRRKRYQHASVIGG